MTELEKIGEQQRNSLIPKNTYNDNKEYNSNNPNALSDGDEKGRGQKDDGGTIGTLTDINTRKDLLGRNLYLKNDGYNSNNSNALSDGDEKGK